MQLTEANILQHWWRDEGNDKVAADDCQPLTPCTLSCGNKLTSSSLHLR